MNKKNIFRGLTVALFALVTSSCEKDFLDINTSPNSPSTSTPELVLPSATNFLGSNVNGRFNVLGNLLTGNWGQAPDYLFYIPQETYNITPSTYDAGWTDIYANSLKNLQYVIDNANGKKNLVAIAKIVQAYDYQVLVDLWGDVPFTDALKNTQVINPKYDSAASVYDNIVKLIDDGIANIDVSTTAAKPGDADIVFKNSNLTTEMNNWRKFANTLKLRVMIRQSRVASRQAQVSAIAASLANATFLGAGENAGSNPGYANQSGQFSPIYTSIGFSLTGAATSNYTATRANNFALTYLQNTNDTRYTLLYRPVPGTTNTYKGVVAGSTATTGNRSTDLSPVGAAIVKSSADGGYATPAYLITASESFFLQAEAQVRGLLPGGAAAAATNYTNGILESYKLLGSTTTAATTYIAANPTNRLVNFALATTTEQQVEAIVTQKWIALNGINGLEAWTEFRRTGYPKANPLTKNQQSGGKFPVRLPYPQNEVNANGSNIPQIANIYDTRIFWDVD
ncbi:SusD/RagB family nutrient-binding outer membrane lipoprotein [Mucilaginibacter sp. KACC 22063]|uniref:SusD/RagB family nutrient-binding outer membrane lipoprotein n=1 Tax=Mucilaginibacter sp. KACC 22063 TaxID=3025666 RepID=UPI002366C72F|nr:SusD/RagB family nutrient-binding outer membrane lipoprotein [Mucilaginibacter sp. KACC 22063]WDF55269.1 SusD/RagB family nutrient-binding outer membrane lipoprotein [Mucilaginibacter sp. KACC 22063]